MNRDRRSRIPSGTGAAAAVCPHLPNCVGCTLIGNSYGEQLRRKQARVAAAFAPYPSLAALRIPAVIGSPYAFGYRNQAKLVARRTDRALLLGIYRPGTHQVVDIRQCPVHHPLIARALARIAPVLERGRLATYDESTHTGSLRYVVLRSSGWTKAVQVILVTRERHIPQLRELVRSVQRIPGVRSIVQNVNADPGNNIFGREFIPLTRQDALIDRIGFLKLQTHAGAFLQANTAVARRVYEQALRWAAPSAGGTAADLYCGVGALTFYLASTAARVVGIEASPIAVVDAKANVRLNGFHNVRFHCGDAATTLAQVTAGLELEVIALNPPRKGADPATLEAIRQRRPLRIVYVACEPATLARDLDWFAQHGYTTTAVQPFDLLPQTEHVECVAAVARSVTGCPPGLKPAPNVS